MILIIVRKKGDTNDNEEEKAGNGKSNSGKPLSHFYVSASGQIMKKKYKHILRNKTGTVRNFGT